MGEDLRAVEVGSRPRNLLMRSSTHSDLLKFKGAKQELQKIFAEIEDYPQPIESVSHLAHSLSSAKMASDSLIYLFWPSSSCHLLREDVALLDSPGVNVDPDMDAWIDRHCLDADVFILVANAESTLMQAEKDFFYRVSSRISKPNIFILNNRWDASAGEAELADQVKEQHMQRCVSFLTDELKVCGLEEAMERVFFVSAREVLTIRAKSLNGGTPPGSAPNIGSPSTGGYPLADGWQARLMEFSTFEKVFEKILSDSATRTKFASHTEQGKELAAHFRQLMETTYEAALEEKDAGIRYRRLSQVRLEELRAKLQNAARTINDLIAKCLLDVEAQVAGALCNEIRRLGELVDSFSGHSFVADDEATLRTYRHELNAYIERELGKKLADACAGDIHLQVVRAEQIMANIYESLVEADEAAKSRIMQSVLSSSFEPEFHVDCRNICAEFREDLRFRFSLGLSSLAERLLRHRHRVGFYSSGSTANAWTSGYTGSQGMPEYSPVLPLFLSSLPALLSRNTVGLLVVGGIVLKATGWRMIMILGGLYAGLYAYERLAWTNRAREAVFKSQYVDYASHKLRLIVDLTGTNARHQKGKILVTLFTIAVNWYWVLSRFCCDKMCIDSLLKVKRELQQMQKLLGNEGEGAAKVLSDELAQLDKDLVTLDNITTSAKTLKNGAIYLDGCLDKFQKEYMSSAWN
ncbi:unnamed protein product [Taenia asiatica]|uniref:Dynamin-type G domain-containing protein n=1 Tax=Taenia asiatica TaxID=60517 RepID=A0A158R7J7_TAEAS|nr:unnamed protein product [Taenia asiatica]